MSFECKYDRTNYPKCIEVEGLKGSPPHGRYNTFEECERECTRDFVIASTTLMKDTTSALDTQKGMRCGLHAANYVRRRLDLDPLICPTMDNEEVIKGFDIIRIKKEFFSDVTTTDLYARMAHTSDRLLDNAEFMAIFQMDSRMDPGVINYRHFIAGNGTHYVALERVHINGVYMFVLADSLPPKKTRLFTLPEAVEYVNTMEGAFGVARVEKRQRSNQLDYLRNAVGDPSSSVMFVAREGYGDCKDRREVNGWVDDLNCFDNMNCTVTYEHAGLRRHHRLRNNSSLDECGAQAQVYDNEGEHVLSFPGTRPRYRSDELNHSSGLRTITRVDDNGEVMNGRVIRKPAGKPFMIISGGKHNLVVHNNSEVCNFNGAQELHFNFDKDEWYRAIAPKKGEHRVYACSLSGGSHCKHGAYLKVIGS